MKIHSSMPRAGVECRTHRRFEREHASGYGAKHKKGAGDAPPKLIGAADVSERLGTAGRRRIEAEIAEELTSSQSR